MSLMELKRLALCLALCCLASACAFGQAEPEIAVVPGEKTAHPHQPYRFECEISWAGEPGDFTILPAEFDSVEWATIELKRCRAFQRGDVNVVSQTFQVVPNGVGAFETPEIRIAFLGPETPPPPETAESGSTPPSPDALPTLRGLPFTLQVRPERTLAWVSGGLGAAVLIGGTAGWLWLRRGRKGRRLAEIESAPTIGSAEDALHKARKARLDGNYYGFYLGLAQAAGLIKDGVEGDALVNRLKARGQDTGYRGKRPTDDEMDSDYREVERMLAKQHSDVRLTKQEVDER